MIAHANTVVYPGAMVVEALDTIATHGAVPTTTRPDCLTVGAQLGVFDDVKHVHEVDFVVGDVSRLGTSSNREKDQSQYVEY